MKKIIQQTIYGLLVSLMAFALIGCGQVEEPEDLITINKNHELINCIVEPFDETVYSAEELRTTIEEEISVVNLELGEGAVSLTELLVENHIARAEVYHRNAEAYSEFNGVYAFIGTIKEAMEQDYLQDSMVFVQVEREVDEETVTLETIENFEERTIVIVDDSVNLKVYDDIAYYLDGMTLLDDKIVGTSNGVNQAIVIF